MSNPKPLKLLYVVNSGRYFVQHRLSLAKAAQEKGYEVAVATVEDYPEYIEEIHKAGIKLYSVPMSKRGLGILENLKTFNTLRKVFADFKPTLVHSLTIKSVIFAGILCRLFSVPMVSLIPGRGVAFSMEGFKGFLMRKFATYLYTISIKTKKFKICFENPEDKKYFEDSNILYKSQTELIPGSGVDLAKFYFSAQEPSNIDDRSTDKVVVLMACRLLKDKGVYEYLGSAEQILKKHNNIEFWLLGGADVENPNSMLPDEIVRETNKAGVRYIPHVKDVPPVLAQCDIFCLPTYYNEGIPLSVLEASSMGKAVITTSIPGCRDAVINDVTGKLIEPRSVPALVEAITELLESDNIRSSMGKKGRALVEEKFSLPTVIDRYLGIYYEAAS